MGEGDNGPRVKVLRNGPYVVSGGVPLIKATIVPGPDGDPAEWSESEPLPTHDRYTLCRCGHSSNKPYCDGSHFEAGFDGTETASREAYLEQAVLLEGPGVDVTDAVDLCSEARFCVACDTLWRSVERTDDPRVREQVIRQSCLCPSGRYTAWDKETGQPYEMELEPSIGFVEDPALSVSGGLWVRGGIPVESADGSVYETRNRVTLCRCGESKNKPFCDGTHCVIGFSDGL
jgi:CDGSH-type Zn-finger protein